MTNEILLSFTILLPVVTCPAVRPVQYGWTTTTKNVYNTPLTVYCRLGYYLRNYHTTYLDVFCEDSGVWTYHPLPSKCDRE